MGKSYPWVEIKAKYETGKYSMADLAREYNFNANYGRRKARDNDWDSSKDKDLVRNLTRKKVLDEEVDKEMELRAEYEKIINQVRRGAFQALMIEKDFNRLKQFKIFSEILRNCRKEQWEVNEILEIAQKRMLDDQEDKLELFVTGLRNLEVKDDDDEAT